MRTHTDKFKQEISKMGRQIDSKIYCYNNYNFITEDNNLILAENNLQLITEKPNLSDKTEISSENIYSISIIKNGDILCSLMKELDFETKIELNIGTFVNPHFGVLIKGEDDEPDEYEYLDYGNYIVKSKSYNMASETWSYICYDKMLYSMIQYEVLNITYPIKIKDYLFAICEYLGITFEYEVINNITWIPDNFEQYIYSEQFANRNLTFRDVLDKIAEVSGGNLLINDNDNMSIIRLTPILDEELYKDTFNGAFLKNINSNFDKKIGPINQVSIIDTESNLETLSVPGAIPGSNEIYRIEIKDNELAFNGHTVDIANYLMLELLGLEYYFCDFTTTGICYLDFLDRFKVTYKGNDYSCLLLNNEITITQGIEELIYNDETKKTSSEKDPYITSILNNQETSLIVNKQQNEINSKVSKDGIISAINQSPEEIQIQASKIKLEGYTTINDGFSIDTQGNMVANNGTFNGLISSGKIEVGSGYTESNPYLFIGDIKNNNGESPFGVYAWDNGLSVIDYRGSGYDPLIRTEQISGGYAQLKGNHVDAFAFNNVSLAEKKENFELLKSGLEILKKIDIYKYNYKGSNEKKKKIGVVIGDNFNYSEDITNDKNTDVDLYSLISVCCRAIQEQQKEIEELKEMIKNGKC